MGTKSYSLDDMAAMFERGDAAVPEIVLALERQVAGSQVIQRFLSPGPSFHFFIDFTRMKYLYMSEGVFQIMGYTRDEWLARGLAMAFDVLVDEDRETLKQIHDKILQHYYAAPVQQRKNLKFSFDFRVRRKDGKVIRLFEQSSFIAMDEAGKPLVVYCAVSDITNYKRSTNIVLTCSRYTEGVGFTEEKIGFPQSMGWILTRREKDVTALLSDGLSSEQIADRLHISKETVSIHRKNILRKTGCKNTAELIRYCFSHGLLDEA